MQKIQIFRRWLVSAGQADRCTALVGERERILIAKSLYEIGFINPDEIFKICLHGIPAYIKSNFLNQIALNIIIVNVV